MATLTVNDGFLFPFGIIAGFVILVSGAVLYDRPHLHTITGGIIVVFALADLFMSYVFLFPAPAEFLPFAIMFITGPVLAGVGGLLGLAWRSNRFPS